MATDKADYAPGETVHISGGGYAPECTVRIEVTRPDGSVVKGDGSFEAGVDEVTTTADGTLTYDYILNGIEGLYRVRVLGARDAVLASTTFTDANPSDPRAEFFEGNINLCSEVPVSLPVPPTQQLSGVGSSNDPNVSATVSARSGGGEQLDVSIVGTDVQVLAVVVKGADGFNVYRSPAVLPPALPPPQGYIAPLTGPLGQPGNVPEISHWFVCYTDADVPPPPGTGAIAVEKVVISPTAPPVEPLPSTFTVTVTCGEDSVDVTFNGGGGEGVPTPALTGLAPGTTCTVVEATEGFPDGTVVTYDPSTANTTGVAIVEDETVIVAVTNDFTGVELQTGFLSITKVVEPGIALPPTLIVDVACDDGVVAAVTVPGTGGEGTPIVEVTSGSLCSLAEDTSSLPAGTTVTYSIDGGPPITQAPIVVGPIVTDTTITVTVTNNPPDQPPPPPPPQPPTPTPGAARPAAPTIEAQRGDRLPATGAGSVGDLLLMATALIVTGGLARRGARATARSRRAPAHAVPRGRAVRAWRRPTAT